MSGVNLALPRSQGTTPYGSQQKPLDEKNGNEANGAGSGSGTGNGAVAGPGPSAEKAFEQPKEITAVQGLVPTLQCVSSPSFAFRLGSGCMLCFV